MKPIFLHIAKKVGSQANPRNQKNPSMHLRKTAPPFLAQTSNYLFQTIVIFNNPSFNELMGIYLEKCELNNLRPSVYNL